MEVFIYAIIGILVLYFLGHNSKKKKKQPAKFVPMSEEEKISKAKEAALKVKTHRGMEGLQDKMDALDDKMYEYDRTDNKLMYMKSEEKYQILEKAHDYAYENPYRYYHCGEVDEDTSLEELLLVGKSISVQKYKELDKSLQDYFEVITLGDAENVAEANEIVKQYCDLSELKQLIKNKKDEE